ncbi:MAG: hypothetical protein ACK4M7_08575, partial [Burkholderiales bacterium]
AYNLGAFFKDEREFPFLSCVNNLNPTGKFYFIKVSNDLLVADRNIQTNISFDTLRGFYNSKLFLFNKLNYTTPISSQVLNFNGHAYAKR